MTLWLYESMIRFIHIYIYLPYVHFFLTMGSRFELAVFQAFSGLVNMLSPAKKTSTHTHTSSLRKNPLTPKDETLFFGCAYLEHCFFHVGSLWGLWRWCGKLFERTTGLLAIFIDNQVWVGEIQTWTKPRDMRDSKQKLSLNFFAKVRVVWILHSLICHLFESCFFTPVIRYLPVVGCFPLTFLV